MSNVNEAGQCKLEFVALGGEGEESAMNMPV